MPRKKVVKTAARKKQPSKQASKTVSPLLKLENDFSEAPAKIAELLAKEISALKQKESKLNATLSKIQTQISKIEKSIAAATKIKTAAGKKQLAAAKKVLNDTKKDYAFSISALKETTRALADAEIRLARITALTKTLKQFAKDWDKTAKKLKEKAKAKAAVKPKAKKAAKRKAKSAATAAPASDNALPPVLTVVEQPDFDSTAEDAEFDDVKQATS